MGRCPIRSEQGPEVVSGGNITNREIILAEATPLRSSLAGGTQFSEVFPGREGFADEECSSSWQRTLSETCHIHPGTHNRHHHIIIVLEQDHHTPCPPERKCLA